MTEPKLTMNEPGIDEVMDAFIPPPELVEAGGHRPEPTATDRQMQIADVWYEAGEAAANACYGGALEKPVTPSWSCFLHWRRTLAPTNVTRLFGGNAVKASTV